PENAGRNSRRFAGLARLRDAAIDGVFDRGERADIGRRLWRAFALGRGATARARNSYGDGRRAARHSEAGPERGAATDRAGRGGGTGCGHRPVTGLEVVSF